MASNITQGHQGNDAVQQATYLFVSSL